MNNKIQIDSRLRLADFVATKVSLTAKGGTPQNEEAKPPSNIKINIQSLFPQETPNLFLIKFVISLETENFNLELETISKFISEKEYTDEFKKSPFIKINAPAIAFPFVRSYINTLVSSSGLGTFFLPAINFAKLADEKNSK